MNAPTPLLRRAALCRGLVGTALALLAFLALSTAHGQVLRTYRATWSGASFGNTARAEARIVIDLAKLNNPGISDNTFGAGTSAITSMEITVFNASAGNGTWTAADFNNYFLRISDALNLVADWVGQPQPSAGPVWGDSAIVPGAHSFAPFAASPGAPNATFWYELTTNNGGPGDSMRLTSFAPYAFGGPGAHLYRGDLVDLHLTPLITGELAPLVGETVRILGLPAGLGFDPATRKITGQALGPVGNAGVRIQVRRGSRVLRTLFYNLLVEPYKFAGGFEVLLEAPASELVNADGISIPSSGLIGEAAPYPSVITVPPLPLEPVALRVKLNGFSHTFPDDVDIILVAPDGAVAAVMSDAGGGTDAVNADLVFDDSAATPIPDSTAITTGTYQPVDYAPAEALPPGAVGPLATNLNALLAGSVEGDWQLFVRDDFAGVDGGSIISWALEFDYGGGFQPVGKIKVTVASPTRRSPNPAFTAVMNRLGEPRRVSRGQIMMVPGPAQDVVVQFPATRRLPAAGYNLTLIEGSELVTGTSLLVPAVQARGFRLVRAGRVPGSSLALTTIMQSMFPDGVLTPGGYGHATSVVNSRALVRMRGRLGDYTPFTTTLCLSHTTQAVVWLTPYRNKLSYFGGIVDLNFVLPDEFWLPGRGASMEMQPPGLSWRTHADAHSRSYPDGFGPLAVDSVSGRWNRVPSAEALASSLGLDFRSLFFEYQPAPPMALLPETVRLRDNRTFLALAPNGAAPLAGRANGRLGSFGGILRRLPPATRSSFSGVFFQESFFGENIGAFALKVPISGPGLPRGSFRTYGAIVSNAAPGP